MLNTCGMPREGKVRMKRMEPKELWRYTRGHSGFKSKFSDVQGTVQKTDLLIFKEFW